MKITYNLVRDFSTAKDLKKKLLADEESFKKLASAKDDSGKSEAIEMEFVNCGFSLESIEILNGQLKKYPQIKTLSFKDCTFYPKGDIEKSRKSMVPVLQLLGKGVCKSGIEHFYFYDGIYRDLHVTGSYASLAFVKEIMPYAKLKTFVFKTSSIADTAICDMFEKGQSFITQFEMRNINPDKTQQNEFDKALINRFTTTIKPLLEKRSLERSFQDLKIGKDMFKEVVDPSLPQALRFSVKPKFLRDIPEASENELSKPAETPIQSSNQSQPTKANNQKSQ